VQRGKAAAKYQEAEVAIPQCFRTPRTHAQRPLARASSASMEMAGKDFFKFFSEKV
jgi:hypothetical protein